MLVIEIALGIVLTPALSHATSSPASARPLGARGRRSSNARGLSGRGHSW
jgi:hypothetical protein